MASGVELATAYVSLVGETNKLKKDIDKAFEEADRASVRAGKKIGTNLSSGLGGTKNRAAAAGKDAAEAYERSLKSSIRGEKLGEAIGRPIGKGIGLAIKGGIGLAAVGATAAVGTLAASLTKGFARLKNIDNAKFKLQALGNSAGDVKKIMDSALESVKGTAFGLDSAANTAATAVAAGVPTGQSLTDYLTNVADAAAIAQTSLDEMGSIFNKVQTNGKAMTDDLRMLADRGLPIFTWLQKQYGVTGEALSKMVQDGKVSAADFNRAISDNIGGAAQKMGQSFDGAMQNLDAALGRLGATLLGLPFENASGGIGSITAALDNLNGWITQNQDAVVGFWAALADAAIYTARGTLRTIGAMTEALGGFVGVIGKISNASLKFQALGADLRGDHDYAEELRAAADEAWEWGSSMEEAGRKMQDQANDMSTWFTKVDQWANKTKDAAAVARALGDSFKEINANGEIIVESNALEKLDEINELELVVKNLPDGQFAIVPGTPEAQALIDAFVAKNNPTAAVKTPVTADTSLADAEMRAFRDRWSQFFSGATAVPGAPTSGLQPPAIPEGYTASPGQENPLVPVDTGGAYVPYDPRAWQRPPFGGGRQSGGPIGGPGPKGKDSVLIWAAPGEHMMTADEVDALGGQGGAYALRAAIRAGDIPGMSDGGYVKKYEEDPLASRLMWFGLAKDGKPKLEPTFGGGRFNPNMKIDTSNVTVSGPSWLFERGIESGNYPNDLTFDDVADAAVQDQAEWDSYTKGKRAQKDAASRQDPLWDWIAKDLPRFQNGGAIGGGGRDPRIKAIDTAYQNAGKPYDYGPWDCSMYLSHVYAGMTGQPPGRYFTTESDFEALGFKRGYKPGALNVGIRRGGGGRNSHMAGTLPNGVNIENSSYGSVYGEGAAGANDFPIQYYYEPPNSGDMGEMQARNMQGGDGASLAPYMTGGGGSGVDGGSGGLGPADSGRKEGYIPAGAGSSGRAGTSFASGLVDMGAQAINGLIDQAASAASSAVGMASMAGSFGADGGAGGMAAQMAIGMGTQAAKRGVQWGADMIGIGIDSAAEIMSPFGVPRWFSTDPTGFMPNFDLTPAAVTSAEQALSNGVDPNTTQHGQAQGSPPGPQTPQANLQAPSPEDLHPQEPGLVIGEINGMDPEQVGDQLLRFQRLNSLTHQGRP